MSRETTYKGKLGEHQRLLSMLSANSADLQHLEASRERFAATVAQALEAADRQAVHTAAKQDATQQLRSLLVEGDRQATILRLAVKQHYGIRSEKLAEFGLQPFRGRTRGPADKPEPTAPPAAAGEPPVDFG